MIKSPVELSVDGQNIVGNIYCPNKEVKNVGVLFLHGWTGKPNEQAASFLADAGYTAITINMRGHGDSDGDIRNISINNSLDDAVAAYDLLATTLPKECPIIVVGNSYGAYISVLLSSKRNVAGLSLRVPAIYPDGQLDQPQWGKGHEDIEVAKWRNLPCNYSDNEAYGLVHKFTGKVQIIEAGKDEIIPHQTIENYKNAVSNQNQLTYNLMKDWPHSIGGSDIIADQFKTVLLSWLRLAI